MTKPTYTCALCGETETSQIDESEMVEQLNREFPGYTPEECDVVCDDCYQKFFGGAVH